MKNKEITIYNKIIHISQLPKDVLEGAFLISMTGNTEILIENFKHILKYQPDNLLLQCKGNQIQIIGKNLTIEIYTNEEIKIKGHILELKFI